MIRVPHNFNGNFISHHFFPEYRKYLKGINGGRCYDWAYLAYRMFEGVELWTTDYHAWVRVINRDSGSRYFDSETKQGVSNFMLLGCNRRNSYPIPWQAQPPVRMEVDSFKKFWDEHGGGFKRHWESMLERKLKEVLGKRYSELTPIFAKPKPALVIP